MPTGEGFHDLQPVAFLRPRLSGPSIRFDMGDEVHDFAAAHHVVNQMAARAHIDREIRAYEPRREVVQWHQAAPAHRTGKPGRLLTKETLPNGRSNAVGSDNEISLNRRAIGEM